MEFELPVYLVIHYLDQASLERHNGYLNLIAYFNSLFNLIHLFYLLSRSPSSSFGCILYVSLSSTVSCNVESTFCPSFGISLFST